MSATIVFKNPTVTVVVVVVSPTKLVVSRVEVMLVYQLLASLCSLRRSFLLVVRMSTKKKPSKVFSSPGTPQWTVPLKLFLKLLDMKMPCYKMEKITVCTYFVTYKSKG